MMWEPDEEAPSLHRPLTVDSKKLEHGRRMIYAGFPFSLVWDQRTAMFQLSGLYCPEFDGQKGISNFKGLTVGPSYGCALGGPPLPSKKSTSTHQPLHLPKFLKGLSKAPKTDTSL